MDMKLFAVLQQEQRRYTSKALFYSLRHTNASLHPALHNAMKRAFLFY